MVSLLQAAFFRLPSWWVHLSEHIWDEFLSSSSHFCRYNRECMHLWGQLLCLVEFADPPFPWCSAMLTCFYSIHALLFSLNDCNQRQRRKTFRGSLISEGPNV